MVNKRLVALMLILAVGLQGPLLAYAAAPGAADPTSATIATCPDGTVPPGATDCTACCTHGSMPAGCAAVCAVPMATPVYFTAELIFSLDVFPPKDGAPAFVGQDPIPLVRPPIV